MTHAVTAKGCCESTWTYVTETARQVYEAITSLFNRIITGIREAWNVIWEHGNLAWQGATHLIFQAIGMISPEAAAAGERLWGHITTVWERAWGAHTAQQLQRQIDRLTDQNGSLGKELAARNDQVKALEAVVSALQLERDSLLPLRGQVAELSRQLQEMTRENSALEAKNAQLLLDVAEIERCKELERTLSRIVTLYSQATDPSGESRSGTYLELLDLIPLFQQHRDEYCQMIETALQGMPECCTRIQLEGIVRTLRGEQGHLERISQSLHLFSELRRGVLEVLENLRREHGS